MKRANELDPYTKADALADVIATFLTGGLWGIWVVIRYLRTH